MRLKYIGLELEFTPEEAKQVDINNLFLNLMEEYNDMLEEQECGVANPINQLIVTPEEAEKAHKEFIDPSITKEEIEEVWDEVANSSEHMGTFEGTIWPKVKTRITFNSTSAARLILVKDWFESIGTRPKSAYVCWGDNFLEVGFKIYKYELKDLASQVDFHYTYFTGSNWQSSNMEKGTSEELLNQITESAKCTKVSDVKDHVNNFKGMAVNGEFCRVILEVAKQSEDLVKSALENIGYKYQMSVSTYNPDFFYFTIESRLGQSDIEQIYNLSKVPFNYEFNFFSKKYAMRDNLN